MKKYCVLIIVLLFILSCRQTPEIVQEPEPEPEPEPELELELEVVIEKIEITVAGFNINRLQNLTASVPRMIDALVEVVSEFDIVIIHGIPNNRIDIIRNINNITNFNNVCDYTYDYVVSSRAGRQQGAVLYNTFKLDLIDTVVLNSPDRPYTKQPFVVFFRIVESGRIFSIFCLESEPEAAMEEIEYLRFDFPRISSKYVGQDSLLLCDLNYDDSYTEWEMSGFPENYSVTVLEEASPDSYNTFDYLFLPPIFNEKDTAFSGVRYFEDIIDYQALNISSQSLMGVYLVWMDLYF